jgi:tRNA-specific 2-thiouridylase
MPLGVRVRYRQREEPALVTDRGGGRAEVEFVRPHEGAARGQSAVFYDGDVVIGGGVIS